MSEFRPIRQLPVYGNGPSLEDTMAQTAMVVGSPREVIERVLTYREQAGGHYQRQLFNVDGIGVPHKTVLEQIAAAELRGTTDDHRSAGPEGGRRSARAAEQAQGQGPPAARRSVQRRPGMAALHCESAGQVHEIHENSPNVRGGYARFEVNGDAVARRQQDPPPTGPVRRR